jgi:hypothetical protein
MARKIYITGTGGQAPYGIGEIIDVVPAAHWRKIQNIVSEYYDAPALHCSNCGAKLDWTYTAHTLEPDGIEICNCQK